MSLPKKKDIKEFLETLEDDDFSIALPADASKVDRTKYALCRKFVRYLKEHELSQADLARDLGIDRSRINEIVKYRVDKFTIDRLYELWSQVEPDFSLNVG